MTQIGSESALYINTATYAAPSWVEIDLARDVNVNDPVDKIDAGCRRTARLGYKANKQGLRDFSIEFETLIPSLDETNSAYAALETARRAKTNVDILHVDGGTLADDGAEARRAICGVFDGSRGEPLADNATRKFSLAFVPNDDMDAPTDGTISGGAFVPAS